MKVLFIGGTGVISAACSDLAIEKGIDLYLLNRGQTLRRPLPKGAKMIAADIRNTTQAAAALEGQTFDAVVDFIAFKPEEIEMDIGLFWGKTKQFVFISSAVVYQKPPVPHVVSESTPIRNPGWSYAQNKIACEQRLMRAYRNEGFPAAIVRPSHTYDTNIPAPLGRKDYTIIDRIKRKKRIIVHGDGTSLWTMTHSEDFAKGLVGLLGNPKTIGHSFHITSDEILTWNQIFEIIGDAAGVEPKIVHVPSDFIARFDADAGASLIGDKAHCAVFDNSKIKQFVPEFRATISFAEGMRRALAWFEADDSRKEINRKANRLINAILRAYDKALAETK